MKNIVTLILAAAILICVHSTNSSITPADYVANLGIGFDVTFAEFRKYIKAYTPQVPEAFANAGFTNVRIRMN